MIYQLNEYQERVLGNMADIAASGEEAIVTLIFPAESDDEKLRKAIIEQRDELQDLEGLGFLRYDEERLIKIASEVAMKLGRSVRVYTITPIGVTMFRDYGNRPKN